MRASLGAAEQHEVYRSLSSHRPPARGGLLGSEHRAVSVAAVPCPAGEASDLHGLGLLLAADRPPGSSVVPFGRHLAFGTDPRTSMSVAWQTPALVDAPFIRYGDSPTNFGERIPAQIRILATSATVTAPLGATASRAPETIVQYYMHAALTDLEPGTVYYYTVGHRGWEPEKDPAAIHRFTTAPRNPRERRFVFTAFGDQGVSAEAAALTRRAGACKPAFHLHVGDISYADPIGSGHITDGFDPRVWDAYFAQIEEVAGAVPWQVVTGNHDVEPWYGTHGYDGQFARFDFPLAGRTWYAFAYGNVAVVSLDGNDVSHEYVANTGYSGGAQTSWLGRQLAAYRADPDIDFVVVQCHYCAYCSSTDHASDGGIRRDWVPLFDRYSVDLVINGHNHLYERTDVLVGGRVTRGLAPGGAFDSRDGTVYVAAGTGGHHLAAFSAPESHRAAVLPSSEVTSYCSHYAGDEVMWETETVEWSRVRYAGHGLLTAEVVPGSAKDASLLRVAYVDTGGFELDSFTVRRVR